MKKEIVKMNDFFVTGALVKCTYGSTDFDDKMKYRLAIKSDAIPYDEINAYESVGAKMTPEWFKEQNGYINLTTIFDIPVQDVDGNRINLGVLTQSDTAIGSEVKVKIRQKEGAIYPMALKVLKEGERQDPFTDF